MAAETFNLFWNDFDISTRKTFQNLISDQDFTDVTLACLDNKQIKAHKVILSACSPFFRSLFLSNPHQHPLIYLRGVHYSDLLCIIQFIYLGQTRVELGVNRIWVIRNRIRIRIFCQQYSVLITEAE